MWQGHKHTGECALFGNVHARSRVDGRWHVSTRTARTHKLLPGRPRQLAKYQAALAHDTQHKAAHVAHFLGCPLQSCVRVFCLRDEVMRCSDAGPQVGNLKQCASSMVHACVPVCQRDTHSKRAGVPGAQRHRPPAAPAPPPQERFLAVSDGGQLRANKLCPELSTIGHRKKDLRGGGAGAAAMVRQR